MRVLFVLGNLTTRYVGPPQAVKKYATALARQRCDVRVVSTTQDGSWRLTLPTGRALMQPAGEELYLYPPGPGTHRPWSWSFARGIYRHVAWADVVHISNLYLPQNLYAYHACKRWQKPYVIQPHGTLEGYQRGHHPAIKRWYDAVFGRRYLRQAAGYHFTSETERTCGRDLTGAERGFVVPIPVEITAETAGLTSRTVLFMGRVTAKKRLDVLLRAWPTVRERVPDAQLVIAGPVDPDQSDLDLSAGPRGRLARAPRSRFRRSRAG